MNEQNARDPFVGLTRFFDGRAKDQIPAYYTIGKVTAVSPLTVRAAGMDLDREDLRIAQHLLPGEPEQLLKKEWGVETILPEETFYGHCKCSLSTGDAWVTRPQETVRGAVPLAVGDEVLLIPSADGQLYYIVDKMVGVPEK